MPRVLAGATSLATGFIVGPVMPTLVIGGAAGVAVVTAYLLTTGLGLFSGILPGKTADPEDPADVSYQEGLFEMRQTRPPRPT